MSTIAERNETGIVTTTMMMMMLMMMIWTMMMMMMMTPYHTNLAFHFCVDGKLSTLCLLDLHVQCP
jgi:hypothetical protein